MKLLELHDYGGTGEALARFHREARAAAAIRSPHVVQILDHGIDQHLGAPFIVMELMEGESLAGRLQRQGRISPAETARVMTHVARALSRAHEAGTTATSSPTTCSSCETRTKRWPRPSISASPRRRPTRSRATPARARAR